MTIEIHTNSSFEINAPDVAAQNLDGEVVVLDLKRGFYYSINHTGAILWDNVTSGVSFNALVEAARVVYDTEDIETLESEIKTFIHSLFDEGLIVETSGSKSPDKETRKDVDAATHKHDYETPVFTKYTDLEDLLLLDPIHDVDQGGWPSKSQ